jgi:hypothetical protein
LNSVTLHVAVNTVLYPKEGQSGDWFIIGTNEGTVKGSMGWRPADGERLKLTGKWVPYKGEKQFKFTQAQPDVPIHPRDQLRYVCERTRGIGPATEQAIWDTLGDDWRNVQNGDVPALDKGRKLADFQEMIMTVDREAEKSQVITWLLGCGSTVNMAIAAWKEWKASTIGIVQQDCYRLSDLPHYGFIHVDREIRKHFDIADNDPRRIRAVVLYSIKQLTESGSTTIEWPMLSDLAAKHAGGYAPLIAEMVGTMFEDGALIGFKGTRRIALSQDFKNETEIMDYVAR